MKKIKNVSALLAKIFHSNLFRAAGTYGFFSLINSAIPFLLLPVMTRYMTPNDYGMVAIFTMMVSLVIPFVGLNSHGAYSRAYFSPNRFDAASYMGTIISFSFFSLIVICMVFFVFKLEISSAFLFPPEWLWAVPIASFGILMSQMIQISYQVRQQPQAYGVFQNSRTLLEITATIFFVVVFGMGWVGRVLSIVFVSLVFLFFGFFILIKNKWIYFCFKKNIFLHSLFFGVPLIPHSLAGIFNTFVGRFFITQIVGIADAGLYTIGCQIGSIIGLVATAFNQAYVPWLFNKLNTNSDEEKTKIVEFTYLYFFIIAILAIVLGALSKFLMNMIVGVQFQESAIHVIWIALGNSFDGAYYMVVNYVFYAEKTHLLSMVTLTGSLLNIIFSYFFIRWNGAIGAAQAMSLTYFVVFMLVWYLSSKVYPMPWKKTFIKLLVSGKNIVK